MTTARTIATGATATNTPTATPPSNADAFFIPDVDYKREETYAL